MSSNSIFLQHPVWPIQRRCRFCPWISIQPPWRCPNSCFSWPLAQHPRLWCSHPACQATWKKHKVRKILCSQEFACCLCYKNSLSKCLSLLGMWMLFWQYQREPSSPCVVWIWHLTVSWSALQCTLDLWVMASQLDATMICGLAGVPRYLLFFHWFH